VRIELPRWTGLLRVSVTALALSLILPAGAAAGTILILDVGSTVSVTDDTGRLADLSCLAETCSFRLNFPQDAYYGISSDFGVNILEPGTSLDSDVLWERYGGAFPNTYSTWTFTSFPDDNLQNQFDLANIVETGTMQTAIVITYEDQLGNTLSTDTIQFQSDNGVPEPSSAGITLAGLAMLGIAALLRRMPSSRAC